jgi:hypothetical protein
MRIRLTLLAALSAVALSTAPAQSKAIWSDDDSVCDALFPSYWQPPGQCPVNGKTWLIT